VHPPVIWLILGILITLLGMAKGWEGVAGFGIHIVLVAGALLFLVAIIECYRQVATGSGPVAAER
jgi:hypothetical protein